MTTPTYRRVSLGGFGAGRPVPRDLWILLGVVFVTFSLQFFATTRPVVETFRLTPLVWQLGFLWQLVTYPFMGFGQPSIWFLLELLILFWFGRDVYWRLGRRKFWMLLAWAVVAGALAAVGTDVLLALMGRPLAGIGGSFVILQGQRTLIAILIAAFAVLYRDATILLFFVLPVQAKHFLWIELLFAFMAFLGTKDLAGFVGLCTAIGVTWALFHRRGGRGGLRQLWLRLQEKWMRRRLGRTRKLRRFEVLPGEGGGGGDEGAGGGEVRKGPWVH